MQQHLTRRAAANEGALEANHRIGRVQKIGEAAGRDEHPTGCNNDRYARRLQRGYCLNCRR